MATIDVFRQYHTIQYTGSNGAEVADELNMSIVSDTGTELQLDQFGDPIPLGKWVVWCPPVPGLSNAEYWTPLTDPTLYFSQSAASSLVAKGQASVSGSALGQSDREFNVQLDKNMGGTSYEVVALVTGGAGHTVASAVVLDADTATVTINSAALSQAATLTVLAIS